MIRLVSLGGISTVSSETLDLVNKVLIHDDNDDDDDDGDDDDDDVDDGVDDGVDVDVDVDDDDDSDDDDGDNDDDDDDDNGCITISKILRSKFKHSKV